MYEPDCLTKALSVDYWLILLGLMIGYCLCYFIKKKD